MAWDWDAYFNSGTTPKPMPRRGVAPPGVSHLRLVRPMDWDAYFNSGSTPDSGPGVQARTVSVRMRPVPSDPESRSAT